MIELINKKQCLFLSFITGFIVAIFFPPAIYPDSQGYIEYDSLRSFGYPLLIFILGKNLKLVIFSQAFLTIFSSVYFSNQLKKLFEFQKLTNIIFLFLISLIGIKISINILPGSFCFSIYLLSLTYAIKSYQNNKIKDYLIAGLLIFITTLIRPQLIFAISHLIIVGLYLWHENKKNLILIISIIIIILIAPNKLNKLANLKFNNLDVSISDTWNQLLIFPLFVSDTSLLNHIKNEKSKDLFLLSLKCAEQKNLTKSKSNELQQNWIYVLESNSFPVKNCTNIAVSKKFPNYTSQMKEDISKQFYFDLVKAHINNNALIFFMDFIKKYSFAFINIYYFAIFIIFSLILIVLQIYKRNKKLFIFNLFLLNHLSNVFIIGLGAPLLLRYRFYTETVLIILILSILFEFFLSQNVKKSNKSE